MECATGSSPATGGPASGRRGAGAPIWFSEEDSPRENQLVALQRSKLVFSSFRRLSATRWGKITSEILRAWSSRLAEANSAAYREGRAAPVLSRRRRAPRGAGSDAAPGDLGSGLGRRRRGRRTSAVAARRRAGPRRGRVLRSGLRRRFLRGARQPRGVRLRRVLAREPVVPGRPRDPAQRLRRRRGVVRRRPGPRRAPVRAEPRALRLLAERGAREPRGRPAGLRAHLRRGGVLLPREHAGLRPGRDAQSRRRAAEARVPPPRRPRLPLPRRGEAHPVRLRRRRGLRPRARGRRRALRRLRTTGRSTASSPAARPRPRASSSGTASPASTRSRRPRPRRA